MPPSWWWSQITTRRSGWRNRLSACRSDIPEWLTPLIAIIAGQLFAYHLTLAKGYNAERPRSIRKVTETQ